MNEIGIKAGAIVLAAGMSTRMGRLKMLLPFGDRPMLARVIESLRDSGAASPILVVTGHAAQEITAVVVEYSDVLCVHNRGYADGGMLSSVKTGVLALPRPCEAFFLVLGDQPMVNARTLNLLRAAWHSEVAPIVTPSFQGKRGHPVLIACRFTDEILGLGAADTMKTFMRRHEAATTIVDVDDPATIQDIDTPNDYETALMKWRKRC